MCAQSPMRALVAREKKERRKRQSTQGKERNISNTYVLLSTAGQGPRCHVVPLRLLRRSSQNSTTTLLSATTAVMSVVESDERVPLPLTLHVALATPIV